MGAEWGEEHQLQRYSVAIPIQDHRRDTFPEPLSPSQTTAACAWPHPIRVAQSKPPASHEPLSR